MNSTAATGLTGPGHVATVLCGVGVTAALASGAWMLVVAAVVLVLLIAVHELGHLVVARRVGMTVSAVSIGFGKTLGRWELGGVQVCWKALPFGGSATIVELEGTRRELRWSQQFLTYAAGPAVNIVVALVLAAVAFGVVGMNTTNGDVDERFGEGVRGHGTITEIDSEPVRAPFLVGELWGAESVGVTSSDGAHDTVRNFDTANLVDTYQHRATPVEALVLAARYNAQVGGGVFAYLGDVGAGEGAVEVVEDARGGRATGDGAVWLLIIAAVSMVLAVTNLIPLPPLDGGWMLVVSVEAAISTVRGAPVRLSQQAGAWLVAACLGVAGVAVVALLVVQVLGSLS